MKIMKRLNNSNFIALFSLLIFSKVYYCCNEALVTSYGFKGLKKAEKVSLAMCPGIVNSCCAVEDQMIMYANWEVSGEKSYIATHYKTTTTMFKTMLDLFLVVDEKAKKVMALQNQKNVGNCKFLAERLESFEISTKVANIKKVFDLMEKFMNQSYQGFYCTICDAENHKFFKQQTSKIQFGENFCRGITESSLMAMLYAHIHLPRVANLTSLYMSGCTFKGDFKIDSLVPSTVKFTIDEKTTKSLRECRRFRDEKDWFVYCKDLCSKFKIAKLDAFFDGHVAVIEKYVEFIKEKVQEMEKEENDAPVFRRVLQEKKDDKKKEDEKKKKPAKESLFLLSPTASMKLDKYETTFMEDGIDLHKVGGLSMISKAMFDAVKDVVNANKDKKKATTDAPAKEGEKKEEAKKEGEVTAKKNAMGYAFSSKIMTQFILFALTLLGF
jgi:hypothetical protein